MSTADSAPRVGLLGGLAVLLFLVGTVVSVAVWIGSGNYGPFWFAFTGLLISCLIAGRGGRVQ